ncbi:UNVERIFIED_CONTAM: hypothetical protein NCL1_11052 [Trichonephila clavipes]
MCCSGHASPIVKKERLSGQGETSKIFTLISEKRYCEVAVNFPPDSSELASLWVWSSHVQRHLHPCLGHHPGNL